MHPLLYLLLTIDNTPDMKITIYHFDIHAFCLVEIDTSYNYLVGSWFWYNLETLVNKIYHTFCQNRISAYYNISYFLIDKKHWYNKFVMCVSFVHRWLCSFPMFSSVENRDSVAVA